MAKLTAWLFTIWGILLVLPLLGVNSLTTTWAVPLIVLVIGLGKLSRNYKMTGKKRR